MTVQVVQNVSTDKEVFSVHVLRDSEESMEYVKVSLLRD